MRPGKWKLCLLYTDYPISSLLRKHVHPWLFEVKKRTCMSIVLLIIATVSLCFVVVTRLPHVYIDSSLASRHYAINYTSNMLPASQYIDTPVWVLPSMFSLIFRPLTFGGTFHLTVAMFGQSLGITFLIESVIPRWAGCTHLRTLAMFASLFLKSFHWNFFTLKMLMKARKGKIVWV